MIHLSGFYFIIRLVENRFDENLFLQSKRSLHEFHLDLHSSSSLWSDMGTEREREGYG